MHIIDVKKKESFLKRMKIDALTGNRTPATTYQLKELRLEE